MSLGRLFNDIWSTSVSYNIQVQVQFSRRQKQTEPRLRRLDKQYRSAKCAGKPSDYLMESKIIDSLYTGNEKFVVPSLTNVKFIDWLQ
jgi:hypothetical protein